MDTTTGGWEYRNGVARWSDRGAFPEPPTAELYAYGYQPRKGRARGKAAEIAQLSCSSCGRPVRRTAAAVGSGLCFHCRTGRDATLDGQLPEAG